MHRKQALRELAAIGREILEQDGRQSEDGPSHATAWPVYQVQQKVRIYGIDVSYVDADGYDPNATDEEPGSWPDERGYPYIERWELVQGAVSLTRSGIEGYLRENGHNLQEPRIYIGSASRCPALRELMTTLETLAQEVGDG